MSFLLTPSQRDTADRLYLSLPGGDVFLLYSRPGMGRTTVLRHLRARTGGMLVGICSFLESLSVRTADAIQEAFLALLDNAISRHSLIIVDDLHLITGVVDSSEFPQSLLFDAALTAILAEAAVKNKKLVFGTVDRAPWPIVQRAYTFELSGEYEAVAGPIA